MNKKVKKILWVFLVFGLVVSGVAFSMQLREVQAATTIKANVTYSESICHETKTYSFKMPSSGYFWYEITPVYYTENGENGTSTSWWLKHTMYVNYKQYENSKAYFSKGTWHSFRYNFKSGTNIQIKIVEDSDATSVWYYKIKVGTKNVKNFEKEPNNSRAKATELNLNKTYTGNVLKDDTDWWVFKAPKSGTYKISGVISDTNQEGTESKRGYDSYLNLVGYVGYKQRGTSEIDEVNGYKTVFKGKLKKGQNIYVKIQYDNWYDIFYKLKIKQIE